MPAAQAMHMPIWLNCPGSQGRHRVCESSGCVPDEHAEHETPSMPISLSPLGSQKVEKSLNVHLLPASHGFSAHVATADAAVQTALLDSSSGSSMVVLVMRRLLDAVTDSDAPFGASLVRKVVSLMMTASDPEVEIPPPLPEVTRKARLDHIAMPHSQPQPQPPHRGSHTRSRLFGAVAQPQPPKLHPVRL